MDVRWLDLCLDLSAVCARTSSSELANLRLIAHSVRKPSKTVKHAVKKRSIHSCVVTALAGLGD